MRTKSISDIQRQADRIFRGYNPMMRNEKGNRNGIYYKRCEMVREVAVRYTQNIAEYQKDKEGLSKLFQDSQWDIIMGYQYSREIYAKKKTTNISDL